MHMDQSREWWAGPGSSKVAKGQARGQGQGALEARAWTLGLFQGFGLAPRTSLSLPISWPGSGAPAP